MILNLHLAGENGAGHLNALCEYLQDVGLFSLVHLHKQARCQNYFFMQIHSVRSGADEPTQFHGFMKFKMERLVFAGGDAFFTLNRAVLSPTSLDP